MRNGRVQRTIQTVRLLMLTATMSNIHIVGTSVLLAKENNGQASYNRGYQLGRKDVRSNPNGANRRHRDEASQWDSDFRRGYEDGYAGRSKNNSAYGRNDGIYDHSRNDGPYDRSRNDGIYDRSRNEDVSGRSGSGQSYRGPGTMTWRGRVNDYVELIIQGNGDQEKGRLADSQRAGEFLQSTTKGRCRRICTKAKWSRPRVRCAATEPIKQLHGHRQNR